MSKIKYYKESRPKRQDTPLTRLYKDMSVTYVLGSTKCYTLESLNNLHKSKIEVRKQDFSNRGWKMQKETKLTKGWKTGAIYGEFIEFVLAKNLMKRNRLDEFRHAGKYHLLFLMEYHGHVPFYLLNEEEEKQRIVTLDFEHHHRSPTLSLIYYFQKLSKEFHKNTKMDPKQFFFNLKHEFHHETLFGELKKSYIQKNEEEDISDEAEPMINSDFKKNVPVLALDLLQHNYEKYQWKLRRRSIKFETSNESSKPSALNRREQRFKKLNKDSDSDENDNKKKKKRRNFKQSKDYKKKQSEENEEKEENIFVSKKEDVIPETTPVEAGSWTSTEGGLFERTIMNYEPIKENKWISQEEINQEEQERQDVLSEILCNPDYFKTNPFYESYCQLPFEEGNENMSSYWRNEVEIKEEIQRREKNVLEMESLKKECNRVSMERENERLRLFGLMTNTAQNDVEDRKEEELEEKEGSKKKEGSAKEKEEESKKGEGEFEECEERK